MSKQVQKQSNEEWLDEYNGNIRSKTKENVLKTVQPQKQRVFKYYGFRTTYLQRLVVSFADVDTGDIADSFFNVSLDKLRGSGKHKSGYKGQFYPPKIGTFRKFWMQSVKREPLRWSTVHKEMNPRLKTLLFSGQTEVKMDKNNNPYLQLIDPVCIGTVEKQ